MKPLKIAVVLIAFAASVTTFAEQSYPILCRGGGTMHFNYTPFSNFSPAPQVWITFTKSPNKFQGQAKLNPGECTWVDRQISQEEPNRIIVKDVKNFSIQWSQGRVAGISSGLSYLRILSDSGRYQSFDVYNDRRGNFVVTRVGDAQ